LRYLHITNLVKVTMAPVIKYQFVHDSMQHEQPHSEALEAIRNALIEGENSGEPKPFDTAAFKQKMRGAECKKN
jgi:Arc/MetJ-type ribon-helix-helix transcriptional regulator